MTRAAAASHTRAPWLLALALIIAPSLSAQILVPPEPLVERGFASDKVYQLDGIESVDLSTGALTLTIPIGGSYPVGGGFSYGLTLVYSTSVWDFEDWPDMSDPDCQSDPVSEGDGVCSYDQEGFPSRLFNAGVGWRLTMGELYDPDDTENNPMPYSWVYVSPDGAQHRFHRSLHFGETEHAYVSYSRDGTYLRMTEAAAGDLVSIDRPDGTTQVFERYVEDSVQKWRLRWIRDALFDEALGTGNQVEIEYDQDPSTGNPRWLISDSSSELPGRTHIVLFEPVDVDGRTVNYVKQVLLEAFDSHPFPTTSLPAVYTFTYWDTSIHRSCNDNWDQSSEYLMVPLLHSIDLPDGTSYSMTYNSECLGGLDASGVITSLTLPTMGSMEWAYQNFHYSSHIVVDHVLCTASLPPGAECKHPVGMDTLGLKSRSRSDRNGIDLCTWTYETWLENPPEANWVPQERRVLVRAPDGNDTVHYFRTVPDLMTASGDPSLFAWDYGLPYTRRTSPEIAAVCGDMYLSAEHFDGPISGYLSDTPVAGARARTECVRYEHDAFDPTINNLADADYRHVNRHLAARRVFDHEPGSPTAGTFSDAHSYDFDGLGHHRVTVTDGNFPGNNRRLTVRNYNPDRGTYKVIQDEQDPDLGDPDTYADDPCPDFPGAESPGHDFTMVGTLAPWILHTYDLDEAWEDGNGDGQWSDSEVSRVEYLFEWGTGFLERTRVLAHGTALAGHDLLSVFTRDDQGNTVPEQYYGGDGGGLPLVPLDALSLSGIGDQYQITHTYAYGALQSSCYANASGACLDAYTTDLDIDQWTGKVKASRTASGPLEAGIETTYAYDELGRITGIDPEAGHGASVEVEYTPATTFGQARVDIYQRPDGSSTGVLTHAWYAYDDLGRPTAEKRLMADGTISQRLTGYDAMGRIEWVSEWQPGGTSGADIDKTTFAYDLFGRVRTTIAADGSVVSTVYHHDGTVERTVEVSDLPSTTVEHYDRHGRLYRIDEPAGAGDATVTTDYTYDVGSRLTGVSMPNGGITQTRTFTYDNRGFLRSETVPEKGPGQAVYSEYDARGHAWRVNDGRFELTLEFDRAERPLEVSDATTGEALKVFTYDDANNHGWSLGKLRTSEAHNQWSPDQGTDCDFVIAHDYAYGGIGGRVSARETRFTAGSEAYATASQGVDWNDLGQLETRTYPVVTVGADSFGTGRVVENLYSNGILTGVTGFAGSTSGDGITYHPNGTIATVHHANDVTDSFGPDPHSMARPESLSVNGPSGSLWASGAYLYDGVGNITDIGADSFHYDPVSRLDAATVEGVSRSYDYDSAGNMVARDLGDGTGIQVLAAAPATNRLSAAGYDDAGNMITWGDGPLVYDYDWYPTGAMSRKTSTDGLDHTYFYDAGGERLLTLDRTGGDEAAKVTYTLRGLDQKVLSELAYERAAGTWSWSKDYIWRASQLLASDSAEYGISHYHLDHLGSPRRITDGNAGGPLYGTVVADHTYHPFGQELSWSSSDDERLKFTGHERDLGLPDQTTDDLDYMHARYYNPNIARFLSVDPVGGSVESGQSLNRYSYVTNNPVNAVDPTGKYQEDVHHDLTMVLALAVGFDSSTAAAIAAADQGVDDDPTTGAFSGQKARADYHFASSSRRGELWTTFESSPTPESLGVFLHVEQDSFSHAGFGPSLGHASAGHRPDKTSNDPAEADRMAAKTYMKLAAAAEIMAIDSTKRVRFGALSNLIQRFNSATSRQKKAEIILEMRKLIKEAQQAELNRDVDSSRGER